MSVKSPRVGLAFLLSQVGAHAAACFGQRLSTIGITPQHAGLLRMLGANPGMTQQAIARLFGILPSRLVTLLDELEHMKLVSRRSSPADRRSYHLHVTAAGRRCIIRIADITQGLEEDLFLSLNAAEREAMADQLSRVIAQQSITPAVHPAYRTGAAEPETTAKSTKRQTTHEERYSVPEFRRQLP